MGEFLIIFAVIFNFKNEMYVAPLTFWLFADFADSADFTNFADFDDFADFADSAYYADSAEFADSADDQW